MKDRFITSYMQSLKLLEIGRMTEVKRWYTCNHPTLIDGILMNTKPAPFYGMTDFEVDKYYIPAPNFDDAYAFLKENGVQYPENFIKQPLAN